MPGFQSYLDNAEKQTGLTPRQFVAAAQEASVADAKPGVITTWLKDTYGLGHGHAANLAQLITKGPEVLSEKYNAGTPLRLNGIGSP